MQGELTYTPFLKTKRSEMLALRDTEALPNLRPLFDVHALGTSTGQKKTLADHVSGAINGVIKAWPSDDSVFVDTFDLDPGLRGPKGEHPVGLVDQLMRGAEKFYIPVTGLDRDSDHRATMARTLSSHSSVAIRLLQEDMEEYDIVADAIETLLYEIGATDHDVHLLLDYRSIWGKDLSWLARIGLATTQALVGARDWASFTVSASNMPQSVREIAQQGEQGTVARREIELWRSLGSLSNSDVDLNFGDYGIVHPEYLDLDPRIYNKTMGPTIKYALPSEWFVVRGSSFSRHPDGFDQYYDLAEKVASSPAFGGEAFSAGDAYVASKARREPKAGNPSSWIRAGTSRHLMVTLQALAQGTL